MAGHGGARNGAGRKTKYTLNGEPLKTYSVRIPEVIPEGEIRRFVREKLDELESNKSNLSEDEE